MKPHLYLAFAFLLALPQTSPAASGESMVIEEVVVTARKREEGLLEAPLSVSALPGSELRRLQVDDLGGLQRVVPNLALNMGDAANAIIYVRGVGQRDSLSFADPGVGVYLDDVYLGRAQGAFMDVIDVERIEVLRGPQGTLYGRNTIGGAIKYVSARPTPEPLFDVEAGFGNYDERMARAVLSGPLDSGGDLLGRLTFAYGAHDGYTDNTHAPAGDTDGDRDSLAWRAQLNYAPGDKWAFNLALDRSVSDPRRSMTPARVTAGPVLVAATAAKEPSADPFEVEADFNDLEKLEVQGASLGMEYAITESVALKSVTAWREVDHRTHIDLDGTGYPIFGVLVDQDQEQFSQEIQLSFASGQAFTGLVGAYWFSEEDVTPDGINNSEPIDFAFGGGFFLPYNTVSENDQRIEAGAVFGEMSWLAGNGIELTAGLRYTDETRRLRRKGLPGVQSGAARCRSLQPAARLAQSVWPAPESRGQLRCLHTEVGNQLRLRCGGPGLFQLGARLQERRLRRPYRVQRGLVGGSRGYPGRGLRPGNRRHLRTRLEDRFGRRILAIKRRGFLQRLYGPATQQFFGDAERRVRHGIHQRREKPRPSGRSSSFWPALPPISWSARASAGWTRITRSS